MPPDPLITAVASILANSHSDKIKIQNFSTVGGGSINVAERIETNKGPFFIKWNASAPLGTFGIEKKSLQDLKNSGTSLVIPAVLGCDEDLSDYSGPGFLLLEYLESNGSSPDFDENFGRGLAELHRQSNDNFGYAVDNYCGLTPLDNSWKSTWPDFYSQNRINHLIKLLEKKKMLSQSQSQSFQKFADCIPKLIQDDEKPALIHGDLWSGNYFNTSRGAAIIDPAAYFAHREAEFGMIFLFGSFSNIAFSAYEEVYPLQSDWRSRLDIYIFFHVFNHYYLFGGHYGSQALEIARKFI